MKWRRAVQACGGQERFQIPGAGCGVAEAAVETHHGEPRGGEAVIQRRAGLLVAAARYCHGKVLHHRVVADDQQRAARAVLPDDSEIAGGVFAIERVGENHAAGVGMRSDPLQRFARPPRIGTKGHVGDVATGSHRHAQRSGIVDAGSVERAVEISRSGQRPSGFRVPKKIEPVHMPFRSAGSRLLALMQDKLP